MLSFKACFCVLVVYATILCGVGFGQHTGHPNPPSGPTATPPDWEAQFISYIQIQTVHPHPNYTASVAFLQSLAQQYLGDRISTQIKTYVTGKPTLLITWSGHDPTQPGVLLVSHMDVVPVEPSRWTYDPFGGIKDSSGRIFGRGTQDDKALAIQYLAAIYNLIQSGFEPHRTIYVIFSVDEEIGGTDGLGAWFADSATWQALNIGFILDEGMPSAEEELYLFNGERMNWWITLSAQGPNGHGSMLLPNTAVEQLQALLPKFHQWRASESAKFTAGSDLGSVITVNVDMLFAGVFGDNFTTWSTNTIPGEAKAAIDLRFPPNVDLPRVASMLSNWTYESNITLEYHVGPFTTNKVTDPDSAHNPWWKAILQALKYANVNSTTKIFPAGTDSARFRRAGIPAVGFSPIRRTPNRMHADDEFLPAVIFQEGISIYEKVIAELSLVFDEVSDPSSLLLDLELNYPIPGDISVPPQPPPHTPVASPETVMSYKTIAAVIGVIVLLAVVAVLGVAKYRGGGFIPSNLPSYSQLSKGDMADGLDSSFVHNSSAASVTTDTSAVQLDEFPENRNHYTTNGHKEDDDDTIEIDTKV